MKLRDTLLAAVAAALMGSGSALAADLGRGSIKDGYVEPMPVQSSGRGIYLRGDFGWAHNDFSSIYEPPAYDLSNTSIGRNHTLGLGVGYYFSKNVRGDFTYDWRSSQSIRGSVNDGKATVEGERQFSLKNGVGLFNVYYDFDTRSHFTPYLGVGLGWSRNTTSAGSIAIKTQSTDSCDPGYAGGAIASCSADFDGATKTSAAGALMAGFSARLHDRLHLDAGYRYLYMGTAHTGDIKITHTVLPTAPVGTTIPAGTPTGAPDPIVHDLSAHEFRVGLRWDIK